MQNRIILVSDDDDFFEYICPKLRLRKRDELFRFCFDDLPEKLDLLLSSLLIINAEEAFEKTLDLLSLVKGVPTVVFNYNDDEKMRIEFFRFGCHSYITAFTPDEEFEAKTVSALNLLSTVNKKNLYREILVSKNLIEPNNEVFLNCNEILDDELGKLKQNSEQSVLVAISTDEKTKFLVSPHKIETVILNNIRKNDILMSFAAGKYFLLLNNLVLDEAYKIWEKIQIQIQEKIYAGFAATGNLTREQVVNNALNKLHEAMTKGYNTNNKTSNTADNIENFKIFRIQFNKNFEKVIEPVFYHFQQKYSDKFLEVNVSHQTGEGFGKIFLKSRNSEGTLKITAPGCTKINIDITYISNKGASAKVFPAAKRITLEPNELESAVLEEILEQFILEFKNEVKYEYT